jgi:hypothetical protein
MAGNGASGWFKLLNCRTPEIGGEQKLVGRALNGDVADQSCLCDGALSFCVLAAADRMTGSRRTKTYPTEGILC